MSLYSSLCLLDNFILVFLFKQNKSESYRHLNINELLCILLWVLWFRYYEVFVCCCWYFGNIVMMKYFLLLNNILKYLATIVKYADIIFIIHKSKSFQQIFIVFTLTSVTQPTRNKKKELFDLKNTDKALLGNHNQWKYRKSNKTEEFSKPHSYEAFKAFHFHFHH